MRKPSAVFLKVLGAGLGIMLKAILRLKGAGKMQERNKLKCLDLFCRAGGAGMGYAQTGMGVTGQGGPSKKSRKPSR